ncbi:MAG: contact-dependent growth inhibition system immunity protein [Pseudomonadota bacterium]
MRALDKPLSALTPVDLNVLLTHGYWQTFTVGHAISLLEENPFMEAQYYQGDLLKTLLGVSPDFWSKHEPLWIRMHGILHRIDDVNRDIAKARNAFTMAMK